MKSTAITIKLIAMYEAFNPNIVPDIFPRKPAIVAEQSAMQQSAMHMDETARVVVFML